jgi:hypothetical protein
MFLVSAFARLEAFAEGEAQSMFSAAASPTRSASHSFPEMDSSDYIFLTWIDG